MNNVAASICKMCIAELEESPVFGPTCAALSLPLSLSLSLMLPFSPPSSLDGGVAAGVVSFEPPGT